MQPNPIPVFIFLAVMFAICASIWFADWITRLISDYRRKGKPCKKMRTDTDLAWAEAQHEEWAEAERELLRMKAEREKGKDAGKDKPYRTVYDSNQFLPKKITTEDGLVPGWNVEYKKS